MGDSLCNFFVSYGKYHNNSINKCIHMIFIPILVVTLQGMLLKTSMPQIASVLTICLGIGYIYIDCISGLISMLLYVSTLYSMDYYNFELHLIVKIHIISWIIQFIGHGFFEKRAPALCDNLLLTLVAPHFVILEILFSFGYKNHVFKKAQKLIESDIKRFKQNKKQK